MRRALLLTLLACGPGLISFQARAQTDEPLAEAKRLNGKCAEFYRAGKYDEAIEPCQRALVIREKVLGGEHVDVATSLNNIALLYATKGDYTRAEPFYQRALAIDERALGPQHPDLATDLNNLAELYRAKGDYARAEPLYQRALAIFENALGPGHPIVATSLNNLAGLYGEKGDYARAEPLYQRALAIREKTLGPEHADIATSLNNLAGLYDSNGDYARAEPLYQRALAIFEKAFDQHHPLVATSLNNLARLYKSKGDYARAEPLYQRALAIREKALGSEHPVVATSLNNLAGLYAAKGEYARAEPLYQRALAIFEKALGPQHPDLATDLNNLAELYREKGDSARAEPLYQRALAIREKALGPEHPDVATTLTNLATLYEARGDHPRAIEFRMRSQEIRESNINSILATGSERQKQLYLDTLSGETTASVSLHAYSAPSNVQAAHLALTTILRRKGRALDAMTDQIANLRRRAAPDDVNLLDALATAQSQLANLQLSNDTRLSRAEIRARASELETEIERLQNDIGRRNAEFRARSLAVTLDAVRGAIPTDAALVEIFVYRPFNAKAKSIYERYGTARYIAYSLKPTDTAPQFFDLGDAASIDANLKLWRAALVDRARTDTRQLGRQVDERVMRPIRKLLGETKRLFISPDGALNLVPFAALVDENDKYLAENYTLTYLTSGRDLLRLQVASESRQPPTVLANPLYNLNNAPATESLVTQTAKRDAEFRQLDFTKLFYPPLSGTAKEAASLASLIPNARVWTNKLATEGALKNVSRPRILHIATHGFFLADQPQAVTNRQGRQLIQESSETNGAASRIENPMLRSGLILAGVNQHASGTNEDGVLTAAEAAGLDLFGTKLVVLSACETGIGEARNGDSVYGLRRALVLSGSESQVMSLWKVSDEGTQELMTDYYTRLQRGEGRTEALRQVQLIMIRSDNREHPYYWASFIQSGAWTPLSGTGGGRVN